MKKNKIGIILIISLLVILLLTIGIGFFFIFKTLKSQNNQEVQTIVVQEETSIEDIVLFPIEDSIYTNLKIGEDGREHVIKLSVNLGIDYSGKKTKESDNLVAILTEKTAVIKDSIIGVLRNKTFEEIRNVDTQQVLKEEILINLQEQFDTDLIIRVYINDLILQ